jgi:hypothetical protein
VLVLIERNLLDHQHRYGAVHLNMRLKFGVRHPGADARAGALRQNLLAAKVVIQRDADRIDVMDQMRRHPGLFERDRVLINIANAFEHKHIAAHRDCQLAGNLFRTFDHAFVHPQRIRLLAA